MKIERNGLCPCQSGAKYKKCCRVNPERIEAANFLNAQYIDRDYVLSDLKQRSTTMEQFLDAVPAEIIQLLWIFVDPKLNANMRSMAGFDHFGIIVKQLPIAEDDFFDFAHEIGHIVLSMMNYPLVQIISGNMGLTSLATVLTNAIMDPLVNRFVVQFGFDINEYMRKGIRLQSQMIKSTQHNSVEDRHFLRCLCIEKILEWRILNIPFENAFLPIFQEYHPDEYAFASQFVDSLEIPRLDDPHYVRDELSRLIRVNQMQHIISLV